MLAFAALILSLLAPVPGHAVGGCSSSGCGGDFSATEFKDLAADIFKALGSIRGKGPIFIEADRYGGAKPVREKIRIEPEELLAAFRRVSVVNDKLYLDERLVSFDGAAGQLNFSERDWKNHPYRVSRLRIVMHQLLMLAAIKNPKLDDNVYDEQLSRSLAKLVISEEEKHPPPLGRGSQDGYCLAILPHVPLESRKSSRVFDATAADVLTARQLAVTKCEKARPGKEFFCRKADIRCSRQRPSDVTCRFQPPGALGVSFTGRGHSTLEAQYDARKACVKAGGDTDACNLYFESRPGEDLTCDWKPTPDELKPEPYEMPPSHLHDSPAT